MTFVDRSSTMVLVTETMTPVEHDTELLRLHRAAAEAAHYANSAANTIMSVTDTRTHAESYKNYKRVPDPRTFGEALATLKAGIADPENAVGHNGPAGYDARYSWPNYLARYETTKAAAVAAALAVDEHEANYEGWDRFWLVTSSPGHVHKNRYCSSCRPSTTFALVPTLSSSTEEAAVAMFGETMCSVCFPSAPTGTNVPKAVAEAVGTPGFEKALAKWRAKVEEKERLAAADKAAGRRKRPNKDRYTSMSAHMRRYPAEEGWY